MTGCQIPVVFWFTCSMRDSIWFSVCNYVLHQAVMTYVVLCVYKLIC